MNDETAIELLQLTADKISELKADVAILQLRVALKRFNPSQPRWPASVPVGGQWRPSDGSTLEAAQPGMYDYSKEQECLAQRLRDEVLCGMVKSRPCWNSMWERYVNCLHNVYIPPLQAGR